MCREFGIVGIQKYPENLGLVAITILLNLDL